MNRSGPPRVLVWALGVAAACGSSAGSGADGGAGDAPAHDGSEGDAEGSEGGATLDASRESSVDAAKLPASDGGPAQEGGSDATLATATVLVTADATLGATQGPVPCATVSALTVLPAEVSVGHTIALSAAGVDPQGGGSDVVLLWSSTGFAGSLGSDTGPSNTFTCAGAGTQNVTVTAAMADGGASCPGSGSVSVDVVCD